MAASPDARSAVLEFLGLKSVKIERREPTAPPPRPGTLGAGLGLGTPVTLDGGAPRLAVPAPARRPPGSARPTPSTSARAASRSSTASGRATSAPTRPAPRCSCRSSGPASGSSSRSRSASGSRLERLRVDGAPAYFITGSHGFAYEDDGAGRLRGPAARRQHAARRAPGRPAGADRGGPRPRPRGRDRAVDAVGPPVVYSRHRGERDRASRNAERRRVRAITGAHRRSASPRPRPGSIQPLPGRS